MSFKRGGGSVGCQDSDSGKLKKPSIGATFLGDQTFGVDAVFPAGAHDVRLKALDGDRALPIELVGDAFVLKLPKAAIGELIWVDASGVTHTESVGSLVAEVIR